MTEQEREHHEALLGCLGLGDQHSPRIRDAAGRNHSFVVMKTRQRGFNTERPRYLVGCDTCGTLLHAATTGPVQNIAMHLASVSRP